MQAKSSAFDNFQEQKKKQIEILIKITRTIHNHFISELNEIKNIFDQILCLKYQKKKSVI